MSGSHVPGPAVWRPAGSGGAAPVLGAIEAELPRAGYAVGRLADKLLALRRELPDREWDALATRTA